MVGQSSARMTVNHEFCIPTPGVGMRMPQIKAAKTVRWSLGIDPVDLY